MILKYNKLGKPRKFTKRSSTHKLGDIVGSVSHGIGSAVSAVAHSALDSTIGHGNKKRTNTLGSADSIGPMSNLELQEMGSQLVETAKSVTHVWDRDHRVSKDTHHLNRANEAESAIRRGSMMARPSSKVQESGAPPRSPGEEAIETKTYTEVVDDDENYFINASKHIVSRAKF